MLVSYALYRIEIATSKLDPQSLFFSHFKNTKVRTWYYVGGN